MERKDVIERYFRDGQFVDAEREVLRLRKEMEEEATIIAGMKRGMSKGDAKR